MLRTGGYLVELRILVQKTEMQKKAVTFARKAVESTLNQYKAGTACYLNVMTAQATALTNEETAVDIEERRLNAVVQLVKALRGGWENSDLPAPDKVGGEFKWSQFLPVPVD